MGPIERDEDNGLAMLAIVLLALMFLFGFALGRASGSVFADHAQAAIANPSVEEWKRDLFRQALAHNAQEEGRWTQSKPTGCVQRTRNAAGTS